jgi:hypothetical protein
LTVLRNLALAGRPEVADADRARNIGIRALDALNDRKDTESADFWALAMALPAFAGRALRYPKAACPKRSIWSDCGTALDA